MLATFLVTILLVILTLLAVLIYSSLTYWFQCWVSGARVNLIDLIFMRFRKVSRKLMVDSKIMAVKAGIVIDINDLESHHLAGGNVERVVKALIAADKAKIPLKFNQAAAIDLAGRDVLDAVKMSVNPKVIETPSVAAVAKDGIQLVVVARVTVRANIERLVGGAGEGTILARIGEGIVTTMGSAKDHKEVMENPDNISEQVIAKRLDYGTAYEILSVDIADVNVGKNIGAKVETERAEADKIVAQAKAEERRSMAVAREQEMKAMVVEEEAKLHEMRAKVVEAEAKVPLAVAEALKKGQIGIMDFYQIKNIQAETEMRDSIADSAIKFAKAYTKAHEVEDQSTSDNNILKKK